MHGLTARRLALVMAVLLPLGIAGCFKESTPPTFYMLDPGIELEIGGLPRGASIGVGPITVPPYLDRVQIGRQVSPTRLSLSEAHQWADPLKVGIAYVVSVHLAKRLGTNRIHQIPMRRKQPLDFQVAIDVVRFEGRANGEVLLIAVWTLAGANAREPLLSKISLIREDIGTTETEGMMAYEALVAAQSRALAIMSREIADAILPRM